MELADLDIAYLAADHRLSASQSVQPDYGSCGSSCNWSDFETNYGPLLSGTSTHTLLPGAAMTLITPASASYPGSNANAQDMVTEFESKGWLSQLVGGVCDEPGTNTSEWINCGTHATYNDSASPIVPSMLTANISNAMKYGTAGTINTSGSSVTWVSGQGFVTGTAWNGLTININGTNYTISSVSSTTSLTLTGSAGTQSGVTYTIPSGAGAQSYIDYMIVFTQDMDNYLFPPTSRPSYNSWLAGGSGSFSTQGGGPRLGLYTACLGSGSCQNGVYSGNPTNVTYPNRIIEVTSVRNRMMPWIEYWENASIDLYYDLAVCWISTYADCEDGLGNRPPANTSNPYVYQYYSGGNGDGTLIYPGTYAQIGTGSSSSWRPIPLPSIRLKLSRNGEQDYEYMYQLTNSWGMGSYVTSELSTFITNDYTYNNTPSYLMAARLAMGNELHQLALQAPIRPAAPTGLTLTIK
jgi:hypothetical protein